MSWIAEKGALSCNLTSNFVISARSDGCAGRKKMAGAGNVSLSMMAILT